MRFYSFLYAVMFFAVPGTQHLFAALDDVNFVVSREDPAEFTGGIFSSSYDEQLEQGVVPNDADFIYYLFADGLAVRTIETNVGNRGMEKIGLWRKNGMEIECFFSATDLASDHFILIQLRGRKSTRILTPVLVGWEHVQISELLAKSYGYKTGIESIESRRQAFLMSLLPEEVNPRAKP